jgi:hypothetical protein
MGVKGKNSPFGTIPNALSVTPESIGSAAGFYTPFRLA